jgi:hypothetical protein
MVTRNFPIPANWQDFQVFVKDMYNEKYGGFDIYGRNGQAQNGVDIYGKWRKSIIGIQCKRLERKLTLAMVKSEIKKAEAFAPALTKYVIATTDRRDARMQSKILEINSEKATDGLFEVEILYWDAIEDEINGNANILARYYDDVMLNIDKNYKEMHILDTLRLAFTRPAFSTEFKHESNLKDFIQAISDTQEFMNIGKLRNRDGEYISGSFPYKALKNTSDISDGDLICALLQKIRDCITDGIKHGDISHCRDDCYCVRHGRIEHDLDSYRRNIFLALNRIFERNWVREIAVPY